MDNNPDQKLNPDSMEHLRRRVEEAQEIAVLAQKSLQNGNATWTEFQEARAEAAGLQKEYLVKLKAQEKQRATGGRRKG